MKEAEKIINGIKYWSDEDQKNRTAVVILADNKEGGVWGLSKGKTHKNRAFHLFSNDRK